jgi:hypothetical protein
MARGRCECRIFKRISRIDWVLRAGRRRPLLQVERQPCFQSREASLGRRRLSGSSLYSAASGDMTEGTADGELVGRLARSGWRGHDFRGWRGQRCSSLPHSVECFYKNGCHQSGLAQQSPGKASG